MKIAVRRENLVHRLNELYEKRYNIETWERDRPTEDAAFKFLADRYDREIEDLEEKIKHYNERRIGLNFHRPTDPQPTKTCEHGHNPPDACEACKEKAKMDAMFSSMLTRVHYSTGHRIGRKSGCP